MALTSPITSSARRGDAVRAVTGFPVTVGTQVAIPAGAYAEGVIDKVAKRGPSGPSVTMHFTRIVYTNGYSADINGVQVEAKAQTPGGSSQDSSAFANNGKAPPVFALQQTPSLPALSKPGPGKGVFIAVGVAGAAAAVVGAVLFHRGAPTSGTLFDSGWQFEMILQAPLAIDIIRAASS
jgi:hypothetical protein